MTSTFFELSDIVLASGNAGKLSEFSGLLAPFGVQMRAQNALGICDPDETGLTFVENALIKARHASRLSGLPALADDSGLCIDALGGAPGLISAHFAGVHGGASGNIAKVLQQLHGVAQRSARFVSVLVLLRHWQDPLPIIAQGQWRGTILDAPRGVRGFGYDPIFYDPEAGQTAADMAPALKNQRSHRAQAFASLLAQAAGR
jgi:XTP/dITP diphosphohydrolase